MISSNQIEIFVLKFQQKDVHLQKQQVEAINLEAKLWNPLLVSFLRRKLLFISMYDLSSDLTYVYILLKSGDG